MIRTTTLSNGARIVTEVVEEVYSASIGLWIDVGSQDENEKNNGVSHCLEHMLFKGTAKRTAQEIAQEIEDVGGSLGAATGKENTCFYGRVMGDELSVAIDLIMDMLLNAQLTEEALELERQVILEEIKMYEDDPEDFTHETMILNIWPHHALSRPITGTRESVSAINRKMLVEHVDEFYRPEKIIVSIAGKFDEERAIEQLSTLLQPVKRGSLKKALLPPSIHQFRMVKHKDIEQAHVSIATIGLKVTDDKRYQFAILDLCLGGNMSSRLFQEVREKRGLVYTINSFRESHKESGLFGVYAGTSPKQLPQVLTLISEEFQRVKQDGFTSHEITRAKTQLKSELLLGLESMRNRTARNAYGELFYGRQLTVEEIVHDIDAVTMEEVRILANELLDPQYLSLVVVGPKSQLKGSYSVAC